MVFENLTRGFWTRPWYEGKNLSTETLVGCNDVTCRSPVPVVGNDVSVVRVKENGLQEGSVVEIHSLVNTV
jgi:hypothetical protein